jgi:hypothetical protein
MQKSGGQREEGGGINDGRGNRRKGGGKLTPTKLLDQVAVIDVVEVSCAQHAAAAIAPLRVKGSTHNYRPAKRRSMSKRAQTQTRTNSTDASALQKALACACPRTTPRRKTSTTA